MIEHIISEVGRIFVGRHAELTRLEGLWNLVHQKEEHLVYVFLNAPGVGKTTLLDHFGKNIEKKRKGLYIKHVCSAEYTSQSDLNKDLLYNIEENIQDKSKLIKEFLHDESYQNRWKLIHKEFNKAISKKEISLNDVSFILKRISSIIPIFFASDEIQELQKIKFGNRTQMREEETALHYYTRLLKNLLNSQVLLVLSGTRYHILNQIGGDLGSPIKQKVKPLIIQKFGEKDIVDYVSEVEKLINIADIGADKSKIKKFLRYYQRFLFAFSGGHPRTIENITDHFLNYLNNLLSNEKYSSYEDFINFLLPKLEEYFRNTLLSSDHKELLSKLSSNEVFSIVKEWILTNSTNNLQLGERPKFTEKNQFDEEIGKLVYELVNIGIIVQNGNYYYHLTSYFHLLEFINLYDEPYEQFLREVLRNKFFKLMCGFHSGFGYTFETIFSSAILIRGIKSGITLPLEINLNKIRSVKYLKSSTNWSKISIDQNIYYQTPSAEAIDGFLLQDETLFLIQITTAHPPPKSKMKRLSTKIQEISGTMLKSNKINKIYGWIVSLFPYKPDISDVKGIFLTSGQDLIPILGSELFLKLKEEKFGFSYKS